MIGQSKLRLVWVYPDLLSTYGDQGNALIVERRAQLRGIEVERVDVRSDQAVPTQGDIYLIGGGEDRPQRLAAERLRRDPGLSQAVESGATLLAVCAGYQIIGHEFVDDLDRVESGLGLLDVTSGRGPVGRRCVGEVLADVDPELRLPALSGFENHQGVTHIGPGAKPLARVTHGYGNGTDNGTEGAYAGKVIGTYLHGPVMTRNPGLADILITWATGVPLTPLEDRWHEQLRAERLRAVRSTASQG